MEFKKFLKKNFGLAAVVAIVGIGFTSCQRDGCPGQITQHQPDQVQQEQCI